MILTWNISSHSLSLLNVSSQEIEIRIKCWKCLVMKEVAGVRLGSFWWRHNTIPPFCRNHLASHTLCYHGLDIYRIHLQDLFFNTAIICLFLDIYRFISIVIFNILLHPIACVIILGPLWAKVLLLFLFLYLAKCELQEKLQSFYYLKIHCLNYCKSTAITWNFLALVRCNPDIRLPVD